MFCRKYFKILFKFLFSETVISFFDTDFLNFCGKDLKIFSREFLQKFKRLFELKQPLNISRHKNISINPGLCFNPGVESRPRMLSKYEKPSVKDK